MRLTDGWRPKGGLAPILDCAQSSNPDLSCQAARALRNLSCNQSNKEEILKLDGARILQKMTTSKHQRTAKQAARALVNLNVTDG